MNSGIWTTTVRSFAKVNLTLDVLGKQLDGYHALESIMQSISLHDLITLRRTGGGGIRLICDLPDIPTGGRNLAHRAAALFFQRTGTEPGLEITIEKRTPTEAGLGGGSSNAAAVLVALNRSMDSPLDAAELCGLAARIGSDVPFFLTGGTALVRGRGERVEPLPDIPALQLVVIKPAFGVSTAWSYRRLDEMRAEGAPPQGGASSRRMLESLSRPWELLCNDLEAPAMEQHPEIPVYKEELLRAGALGALMCGSGSAVFGLFPDEGSARAASLPAADAAIFIERVITRAEAGGGE